MKRAQVSYFILFGVVLFFFLFFASFVVTKAKKEISQNQPLVNFLDSLKEEPINVFFKKCTDFALRKTILDFGRYGFFPNYSFYGVDVETLNTSTSEYAGRQVPVWISKRDSNLIYDPPLYPLNNFNQDPLTVQLANLVDVNVNTIQVPLFYFGFPNKGLISMSNASYTYETITTKIPMLLLLGDFSDSTSVTLFSYLYPGKFVNYTIKYLFEQRAKEYLEKCLDLEVLGSVLSSNYVLKDMTTKVSFEDYRTILLAEFTFLQDSRAQKNVVKRVETTAELRFPFGLIYREMFRALERETRDLGFNFKSFFNNLANRLGLNAMRYYDRQNDAYIYVLYSNESIYADRDKKEVFLLHFSIKNREPVLFYLGDPMLANNYYRINFKAMVGDHFTIEPMGIDPDDEPVYYVYSPPELCDDYCWKTTPRSDRNQWHSSPLYQASCEPQVSYSLKELIGNRNRCSRVYVEREDSFFAQNVPLRGINYFYVMVKDETGKYDFQRVNVLVSASSFDMEFENIYGFESANVVSVEDLYFVRLAGESSLNLADYDNLRVSLGEHIKILTPSNPVIFPSDMRLWNILNNDKNKQDDFFNEGMRLNTDRVFTISLMSNNSEISRYSLDLEIKQCLPYRSNIYTYPFNIFSNELPTIPDSLQEYSNVLIPYLTNHSCCRNDFSYYSNSETCFNKDFLVCGWLRNIKPTFIEYVNINTSIFSSFNMDREGDITNYTVNKVTIDSKCSGERGNICNGHTTETWNFLEDLYNQSLLEQCVGCVNESFSSFSIKNFTDTTFEKWMKENVGIELNRAFGICKENISTNNLSEFGGIYRAKERYYSNNILFSNDAYLYLCNLTCMDGLCAKPLNYQCINSSNLDSCSENQYTDYYFDESGQLMSNTFNFAISCKNNFNTQNRVFFEGRNISGTLCYSMKELNCNDVSVLKGYYPRINQTLILYELCPRMVREVDCSIYNNQTIVSGYFGNAKLHVYVPTEDSCVFNCVERNCCKENIYECNFNNLSRSINILVGNQQRTYYCVYDGFTNQFKWVESLQQIREFCLDNRDNDRDQRKDHNDPDCLYKLCFKENKWGITLQIGQEQFDCVTDGYIQKIQNSNGYEFLVNTSYDNFYIGAETFRLENLSQDISERVPGFNSNINPHTSSSFDNNHNLILQLEAAYNSTVINELVERNIIDHSGNLISVSNGSICFKRNHSGNYELIQCSEESLCLPMTEWKNAFRSSSQCNPWWTPSCIINNFINFIQWLINLFNGIKPRHYINGQCRDLIFRSSSGVYYFKYDSVQDYNGRIGLKICKNNYQCYPVNHLASLFSQISSYDINSCINSNACVLYNSQGEPIDLGWKENGICKNYSHVLLDSACIVKLNVSRGSQIVNEISAQEGVLTVLDSGRYYKLISLDNLSVANIFAYLNRWNKFFYCEEYKYVVVNETHIKCVNRLTDQDVNKRCYSHSCRTNNCVVTSYSTYSGTSLTCQQIESQ
ncbi:MAG: hypothetical protein QXD62_03240 [Candidatus Woesearchaeota archaeon]